MVDSTIHIDVDVGIRFFSVQLAPLNFNLKENNLWDTYTAALRPARSEGTSVDD